MGHPCCVFWVTEGASKPKTIRGVNRGSAGDLAGPLHNVISAEVKVARVCVTAHSICYRIKVCEPNIVVGLLAVLLRHWFILLPMMAKYKPKHIDVYSLTSSVCRLRLFAAYHSALCSEVLAAISGLQIRCPYWCSGTFGEECTNPSYQVAHATKFCTVAPKSCGSSV